MSDSDDWPPYSHLTEDQQKRYRHLVNNDRFGDAFIYNQLTESAHKLERQATTLRRILWLEIGLTVGVIAILLWLAQRLLELLELLVG